MSTTKVITGKVRFSYVNIWAIVGSTDTVWVWDSDSGDWRDTNQHIDMSQYYTKSEVQAMVQTQLDAIGTISAEDLQTLWGQA